jgi:hypothetical protein
MAILDALSRLSAYQPRLLLLFIESMQIQAPSNGQYLLGLAGGISSTDLKSMDAAIQTDCENIDGDSVWGALRQQPCPPNPPSV